ncbi:DUF7576 family protein [Haladaptatus sp. NG-WS-4]
MNRNDGMAHQTMTVSSGKIERCSNCGRVVETVEWHPVVAGDSKSGFHIHAFCDETCRERWTE